VFAFALTAETSACSSTPFDNSARLALAGPSVCEGSLLKDGRSDKASSDTEESREGGLANEAVSEPKATLDLGMEGRSKAYARDEVEDELDGRPRAELLLSEAAGGSGIARDEGLGGPVLDPLILPRFFLCTKFKVGVLRASTAASYDRRSSALPCSVVRIEEVALPLVGGILLRPPLTYLASSEVGV
jgi:hypothetical protein